MLKLIKGDCLEKLKDIPNASIDMILVDLPYGITPNEWDKPIPLESMWVEVNRVIKNNGAMVFFGSEPFASKLRLSNLKYYKYDYVWVKTMGSGSTGVACINTNRDFIGIEKDEHYFNVAKERLERAQNGVK